MNGHRGLRTAGLFGLVWLALCVVASIYSLELSDDSYQHFRNSVETVARRDWTWLILGLWDKPLPTLLYGLPGQWGLLPARATSAALVTISTACIFDVARRLWPTSSIRPAWAIVAVLMQLSVLPQAFVTMTELPAACALSLGLWLYVRGQVVAGCFAWGCLPLLRVESAVIMACVLLSVSLNELKNAPNEIRRWTRVGAWMSVGALPFISWWLSGVWVSGRWTWILDDGYASLRPWGLTGALEFNALNGLLGVMATPMLFLAVLGAIAWRRIVHDRRAVGWIIGTSLSAHLVFLSVAAIYPPSMYGGLGIAAINARNYNVLAPLLALLVIAGVEAWARWIERSPQSSPRAIAYAASAVVTLAACSGYYVMQEGLGNGGTPTVYRVAIGALLLVALLVGGVRAWERWPGPISTPARLRSLIFAALAVSALITMPTFWYPLRWHDHRAIAVDGFCDWYRDTDVAKPRRIAQDISSRMDSYCGIGETDVEWTWPTDFQGVLDADPGAWLLVAIEGTGTPKASYPEALVDQLRHLRVIGRFPPAEQPRWERLLNRLAWQNPPRGWVLYGRP